MNINDRVSADYVGINYTGTIKAIEVTERDVLILTDDGISMWVPAQYVELVKASKPVKVSAKAKRAALLDELFHTYFIADTPHRTDVEFDFQHLSDQVANLRLAAPNKQSWLNGINKWLETINQAWYIFAEENELPASPVLPRSHFTETTGREYDRLFSWALFQGLTHANDGNR